MAKKKSKSKKVEKAEPKKAPKKSNTAGWVIGAIIVIVIIIAIILLLRGCAKAPAAPVQPTAPSAPTAPAQTAPSAPVASEAPEQVKYCTIGYAIGWPKNKLGTDVCSVNGNTVTAQITFSGKQDSLSGLWFQITTADGKVQYLKDSRTIKQGDTLNYTIDVGQKIEDMVALPIIAVDNVDKACLNQRLLVIKTESCATS